MRALLLLASIASVSASGVLVGNTSYPLGVCGITLDCVAQVCPTSFACNSLDVLAVCQAQKCVCSPEWTGPMCNSPVVSNNPPSCLAFGPQGCNSTDLSCVRQSNIVSINATAYSTYTFPSLLSIIFFYGTEICCPRGYAGDNCGSYIGCTQYGCDHGGTCVLRNALAPEDSYCAGCPSGSAIASDIGTVNVTTGHRGAFCHVSNRDGASFRRAKLVPRKNTVIDRKLLAQEDYGLSGLYTMASGFPLRRVTDCGVAWQTGTVDTASNTRSSRIMLTGNYARSTISRYNSLLSTIGFDPLDKVHVSSYTRQVGSADQAKYICFIDFYCDGFYFVAYVGTTAPTQVPMITALTNAPGYVVFFSDNPTHTGPYFNASLGLLGIPSDRMVQLVRVDRKVTRNDCSDSTLDAAYYSSLFASDIATNVTGRTVGNIDVPPGTSMQAKAEIHWRIFGHINQVRPNRGCDMTLSVSQDVQFCNYTLAIEPDVATVETEFSQRVNTWVNTTTVSCESNTRHTVTDFEESSVSLLINSHTNAVLARNVLPNCSYVLSYDNGVFCEGNATSSTVVTGITVDASIGIWSMDDTCAPMSLVSATRFAPGFPADAVTGIKTYSGATPFCKCAIPFGSSQAPRTYGLYDTSTLDSSGNVMRREQYTGTDNRTDCAYDRCSDFGVVNTTWFLEGHTKPSPLACTCAQGFATGPCDADGCKWCQETMCHTENGATPTLDPAHPCQCPTIFTGTFCQTSLCDVDRTYGFNRTLGTSNQKEKTGLEKEDYFCECKEGFYGVLCQDTCVHGNYDAATQSCICSSRQGFRGKSCEERICADEVGQWNFVGYGQFNESGTQKFVSGLELSRTDISWVGGSVWRQQFANATLSDQDSGYCACVSPIFTGAECRQNTCDANDYLVSIPGWNGIRPFGRPEFVDRIWRCACTFPYAGSNSTMGDATNCQSHLCGLHGMPSANSTNTTAAYDMCTCDALGHDIGIYTPHDKCTGKSVFECPQSCGYGSCHVDVATFGPQGIGGTHADPCCLCDTTLFYNKTTSCSDFCSFYQPCLTTHTSGFGFNEATNTFECACNPGYTSRDPSLNDCSIFTPDTIPQANTTGTNETLVETETGIVQSGLVGALVGALCILVAFGLITFSVSKDVATVYRRTHGPRRPLMKSYIALLSVAAIPLASGYPLANTGSALDDSAWFQDPMQPGSIFVSLDNAALDQGPYLSSTPTGSFSEIKYAVAGDHGHHYVPSGDNWCTEDGTALASKSTPAFWNGEAIQQECRCPFQKHAAAATTVAVGPIFVLSKAFTWSAITKGTDDRLWYFTFNLCDDDNKCRNGGVCVTVQANTQGNIAIKDETLRGFADTDRKMNQKGYRIESAKVSFTNTRTIWTVQYYDYGLRVCTCPPAFYGLHCETACPTGRALCSNRGSCPVAASSDANTNRCTCGNNECQCDDGYYGKNCELAYQSNSLATLLTAYPTCCPAWAGSNCGLLTNIAVAGGFNHAADCLPLTATASVAPYADVYGDARTTMGQCERQHPSNPRWYDSLEPPHLCGEDAVDRSTTHSLGVTLPNTNLFYYPAYVNGQGQGTGHGVCWDDPLGSLSAVCFCNGDYQDATDVKTQRFGRRGWFGTNCQTRTCTQIQRPIIAAPSFNADGSLLLATETVASEGQCAGNWSPTLSDGGYDPYSRSTICDDKLKRDADGSILASSVNTPGRCAGCVNGWGAYAGISNTSLVGTALEHVGNGLCQAQTLHSAGGNPCGGYGIVARSETVRIPVSSHLDDGTGCKPMDYPFVCEIIASGANVVYYSKIVTRVLECSCPTDTSGLGYTTAGPGGDRWTIALPSSGLCQRTCAVTDTQLDVAKQGQLDPNQYNSIASLYGSNSTTYCSNHGLCRPIKAALVVDGFNSACLCDAGFMGFDCSQKDGRFYDPGTPALWADPDFVPSDAVCGLFGQPVQIDVRAATGDQTIDGAYFNKFIVPMQGAELGLAERYGSSTCQCSDRGVQLGYRVDPLSNRGLLTCSRPCSAVELTGDNGLQCSGHGMCQPDPVGSSQDRVCVCDLGFGGSNCGTSILRDAFTSNDKLGQECGGSDRGIIVYSAGVYKRQQECLCIAPFTVSASGICTQACPIGGPRGRLESCSGPTNGIGYADSETQNDCVCACHPGFTGLACETSTAPTAVGDSGLRYTCTGHGVPHADGYCVCVPGFVGNACELDLQSHQAGSGQPYVDNYLAGIVISGPTLGFLAAEYEPSLKTTDKIDVNALMINNREWASDMPWQDSSYDSRVVLFKFRHNTDTLMQASIMMYLVDHVGSNYLSDVYLRSGARGPLNLAIFNAEFGQNAESPDDWKNYASVNPIATRLDVDAPSGIIGSFSSSGYESMYALDVQQGQGSLHFLTIGMQQGRHAVFVGGAHGILDTTTLTMLNSRMRYDAGSDFALKRCILDPSSLTLSTTRLSLLPQADASFGLNRGQFDADAFLSAYAYLNVADAYASYNASFDVFIVGGSHGTFDSVRYLTEYTDQLGGYADAWQSYVYFGRMYNLDVFVVPRVARGRIQAAPTSRMLTIDGVSGLFASSAYLESYPKLGRARVVDGFKHYQSYGVYHGLDAFIYPLETLPPPARTKCPVGYAGFCCQFDDPSLIPGWYLDASTNTYRPSLEILFTVLPSSYGQYTQGQSLYSTSDYFATTGGKYKFTSTSQTDNYFNLYTPGRSSKEYGRIAITLNNPPAHSSFYFSSYNVGSQEIDGNTLTIMSGAPSQAQIYFTDAETSTVYPIVISFES
jgi:hypothetical protein